MGLSIQGFVTVLVAFISLSVALYLRIFPHRVSGDELGVDHWFWKAYVETYRRERHFPPTLPQYILDEEQWYPPLFPLFLTRLPRIIFNDYNHLLATLIDLIRMLLMLYFTGLLTDWNPWALGAAGLSYATTPILISYNIQLNPRGLGALFLDGLIVLCFWLLLMGGSTWLLLPILLLSGCILLTHKMTTQLFWFLCLVGAFWVNKWFLTLIPASVLIAMILSRGFYWKVLRAHWDIVSFWHRNWRWLQAHPIKESPIYGEAGYETPTKMHRKGLPGLVRHLRYLLGYHPGVWMLCMVVAGGLIPLEANETIWIVGWTAFILSFASLTVFVPWMKCLGSGYFYLYNAAFPAALLWGVAVSLVEMNLLVMIYFIITVALNLISIAAFSQKLRFSKTQKTDQHFGSLLNYLRNAPKGSVMCLPPQWYDRVAYETGQPVLYGGHGFGFMLLESVFPRLLVPIREIVERYYIRYLITIDGYLPANFVSDLVCETVRDFGAYRLFLLTCDSAESEQPNE